MPPKKKSAGRGKKGAKKSAAVVVTAEQLELERLRSLIAQLTQERVSEDRAFNDFQQQREKINYFWIVEKKKLEDRRAELRNKEREVQDIEERHAVEVKVYKQRVKHLLHEFQDAVTGAKTRGERGLQRAQEENRGAAAELQADRRALRLDLAGADASFKDYVKAMRKGQDRKITLLRKDFERRAAEVNDIYEERMKTLREELESERKGDLQGIEEQKDAHIERLMKAHERAFSEIKSYYNDITHNNLDLIKALKEEVAEMKKTQQKEEKKLNEIKAENKRMKEPLRKAEADVQRLEAEVDAYEAEKAELRATKTSLLGLEERVGTLRWEHEVLTQRFAQAKAERDDLYEQFQGSLHDVQQKASFRNLLLERRLEALDDAMEQKEAQLHEVLHQANIAGDFADDVRGRVSNVLEEKAAAARQLQSELQRIDGDYRHIIEAVRRNLSEHGVPFEELGITPAPSVIPPVQPMQG